MYDTVITLRHYTLRHYAAHNSTSNSGFRSVRLQAEGEGPHDQGQALAGRRIEK